LKNPGFQEYFLPVLKILDKYDSLSRKEVISLAAKEMQLTDEIKSEILASQNQPTYANRIGWALTYLSKSGLATSPSRAVWMITNAGRSTVLNPPKILNIAYLRDNYPEFEDFRSSKTNSEISVNNESLSPHEILSDNFEVIKQSVYDELLENVLNNSPEFFERLVIDLMLNMGYGNGAIDAGRKLGKSGDEGIDGTISQDKLGLDVIYLQAKRWKKGNNVGRRELQQFVGALSGQNANKGVFITTSEFTNEAKNFQPKNDTKLRLIDGNELAALLYEYGVGVSEDRTMTLKKIDLDYFED
jgi:restriction system protein